MLNILLGTVILGGYLLRYRAVHIKGANPKKGQLRNVLVASTVVYSEILLASIGKLTYASVAINAALVLSACLALELMFLVFVSPGQSQ